MEPTNSSSSNLPVQAEVPLPVKLVMDSSTSPQLKADATRPIFPVQSKQMEPQVRLIPLPSTYNRICQSQAGTLQGTAVIPPITIPVAVPLSPVRPKQTSASLLALNATGLPVQLQGTTSPNSGMSSSSGGPGPPSSPSGSTTTQTAQLGGSGQSAHRSRKEKLICRSGADAMEVQTSTPNDSLPQHESSLELALPVISSPLSPTKTKKSSCPTKMSRPYNRRKTTSESTDKKSKESLQKRVLVSNAQRRVGLTSGTDQPLKRSYKRRNTIATSYVDGGSSVKLEIEEKASPPKSLGSVSSMPLKLKSPEKPKVTVSKGGLSDKESALLPMLSKYGAPRVGNKTPVTTLATTGSMPVPATTSNDKRLPDLRMFGSPNVLPIFKPNQKPWNLLTRLLEGKDVEDVGTPENFTVMEDHLTTNYHLANETLASAEEVNLEFLNEASVSGSVGSESEDSASEEDSEESIIDVTPTDNLEVLAVPFNMLESEDIVLSGEARSVLEQLFSSHNTEQNFISALSRPQRVRSESESSLPPFNSVKSPVPVSRPASTPVSGQSDCPSDVTGFPFPSPTNGCHNVDLFYKNPESYQFKPIQKEAPSSPLLGSTVGTSKWSWAAGGRESPGSAVPFPARFQTPSPSPSIMSSSSTNGGSGRRYSRRRHSRMYPPFETSHCMFSKHFCPAPLEPGSTYCVKHMTEKYSPYYVRCAFMSAKSGRRCLNMQYSRDGKNRFCNMHASRLALLRQKLCRKPRPTPSLAEHLGEMRRIHNKLKKPKRTEAAAYLEDYCDYKLQTQCMEHEIAVCESPDTNMSVEDISHFQVEHDSDGGCDVQDEYECLRNAGYYTTEEVVRILKSKLSKLKELYVKEFDFLKVYYILKRKEYLEAEGRIKNSGIRVSRNPKSMFKWNDYVTDKFILKEMKTYMKTKALLNYHKLRGQTAVLHHLTKKKYEGMKEEEVREGGLTLDDCEDDVSDLEKDMNPILRDVVNRSRFFSVNQSFNVFKCQFDHPVITCDRSALPASNYCHQHILQDENQHVFQSCNYPVGEKEWCQNPLLRKIDRSGCDYHRSLKLKRFCKSKDEKKARQKLLRSMPPASFKEHMTMLEDLVSFKFTTVQDFDEEVNYLLSKGLDCSDTSNSDFENDYDIGVDEEDMDDMDGMGAEGENSGSHSGISKRKRTNLCVKPDEEKVAKLGFSSFDGELLTNSLEECEESVIVRSPERESKKADIDFASPSADGSNNYSANAVVNSQGENMADYDMPAKS